MTCLSHLVLYVVSKAYTVCFPCSWPVCLIWFCIWSARHTDSVFHVHDPFVSFGVACGQQGVHTVFSMFMTRLSHLVLYVVSKAYTLCFPCSWPVCLIWCCMWSARHTHCFLCSWPVCLIWCCMWSARHTHCVFRVHDQFVSFGRQGIHTVFSMFMTRLSHLVLYVVGKVEYQVSSHEDYCKAYIQHFPCSCCGLMKNTPGPTYCVFLVHVVEWWRIIPQGLRTVFSLFML